MVVDAVWRAVLTLPISLALASPAWADFQPDRRVGYTAHGAEAAADWRSAPEAEAHRSLWVSNSTDLRDRGVSENGIGADTRLELAASVGSAVDIIHCNEADTLEEYQELHEMMRKYPDIITTYNLGITSLCIGKIPEGVSHLQTASDSGHVAATHLMGLHFRLNRSFSRAELGRTNGQEDFDSAIHYYEKAVQLIEETRDYPIGATEDMEEIEYYVYTSYYVFSTIPDLYLYGYNKALNHIVNSEERLTYTDSLDVLEKMQRSAERCMQRPSLSGWWDKEEELYQVQQVRCGAYLNYARSVLPLEERRIQVAESCAIPLAGCPAHQEIVNEISRNAAAMNEAIHSIPAEYLAR